MFAGTAGEARMCDGSGERMHQDGVLRRCDVPRRCDVDATFWLPCHENRTNVNTQTHNNMFYNKTRRKLKNGNCNNSTSTIRRNSKNIDNNISRISSKRSSARHFFWWSGLVTMDLIYLMSLVLLMLVPSTVKCQDPFSSALTADDDRCFLQPGGSVANFFINESHPVGSLIGSLKIGGDAREGGDVHLMLADRGVPVQIAPHSKDLILTGRIDKEGKQGQSHISVEVICKRLGTTDPPMPIPVNIRVTDVNDNAPVFDNAPYYVNISEATVVGTIIFSGIHATDQDQKGPLSDVGYSIGPGPHQDKFEFESPVRGSLRLKESLDYEKDPMFNVTIIAQDFGNPPQYSETHLTVLVADSDDQNPAFTRQRYLATLPQPAIKGAAINVQPEPIFAVDQDLGIKAKVVYSLGSDVPDARYFSIDAHSGQVFLKADVPFSQITQPVSLSVYATQTDNPDRRAGTILTVSRRGYKSTQLQFVKSYYNITLPENQPLNSVVTEAVINRNNDEKIRFGISRSGSSVFRVTHTGQIILHSPLDYEQKQRYDVLLFVTDGEYNDTARLIVTVLNVNDWDPRFRYPQYEFHVSPEGMLKGALMGVVEVADGDIGDRIELTLMGQEARLFTVNPMGEIHLIDPTGVNSSEAHVVVMARDSGEPPRQTSVPVTIKFPGSLATYSASFQPTSWFLLVMIFGGLLAVFVLIVICLAVYIHKNKKFREDPAAALPTKLSALVPTAIGGAGGKVQPLAQSRTGRSSSNALIRSALANGHSRDNSGFAGGSEGDEDSPSLSQGRRRYSKNSVMPSSVNSSSANSSANGDGASLNGTSSTASVGTPELPRANGVDGTARATGGMPLIHRSGASSAPPPPPPPPPAATNYLYPHSASYTSHHHSTFSPRQRSPSPTLQYGEAGFPPQVLRPPSAFSSAGGMSLESDHGGHHLYDVDNSRIVWPPGNIPKKVKKLSWEDELYSQTELDPEVSVTPMPQRQPCQQHSRPQEGPGLTVYF